MCTPPSALTALWSQDIRSEASAAGTPPRLQGHRPFRSLAVEHELECQDTQARRARNAHQDVLGQHEVSCAQVCPLTAEAESFW
jgi:hypothetical protein